MSEGRLARPRGRVYFGANVSATVNKAAMQDLGLPGSFKPPLFPATSETVGAEIAAQPRLAERPPALFSAAAAAALSGGRREANQQQGSAPAAGFWVQLCSFSSALHLWL